MNSIMESVCQVCNTVRNNSSRGITFQHLLVLLRREFKRQYFAIKIRSLRNARLDSEEFYVNAYYDPELDSLREIPIEVVIHHNFDISIDWDKLHVTELLIQVFDAVIHEFKHQRQSRKRNFKTFWPNIAYLADPDEIDAYSLSIAVELCRSMGKYRALRYLNRFTTLGKFKIRENLVSPNLFAYTKEFENHSIIKKLAKKVYIRIQKVDTDCIFV